MRVAERTAELRAREETLRERASLLDLTHDTVFVRNLEDAITYWNRGAEELYGWTKEEALGQRTHDLTKTIFPAPLEQINEELHRTGRWSGELTHTKRDGTQAIVSSRWSLQRNDRGEPIGILETNNDVTEKVRAERALRAAEQLARAQVDALTQSLDVLATAPEPDKFIGQMLATIGRHLDAHAVRLWLRSESGEQLQSRLVMEGEQQVPEDPNHPFLRDPATWKAMPAVQEMLFTGGPVVCDDAANDTRLSEELRAYLSSKARTKFLMIPVLIAGEVRGFIGVQHGHRDGYQPQEIELAQALAHQVMLALQLTHLAEQGRRTAVLEERTRFARDIHDTLAQGFTGVVVQTEAAEEALADEQPEDAIAHIRRARELARESLTEARRSVGALRPRALEKGALCDALKSTIRNTTAGTPLQTAFQVEGQARILAPHVEENLLHIGQEALTNALKHAHATRFETRVCFEPDAVRLELRDDGEGFMPDHENGGFGLIGMRERAEQIGGTLAVTSAQGEGTTIVAVAPYEQDSQL